MPRTLYEAFTHFLGKKPIIALMKIRHLTKAALVACTLSFCGMFTYAALPKESKLVKITKKRIPQNKEVSTRCRFSPTDSPHGFNELDLYVNDVVIDYRKKNPEDHDYPAGSIFVKTKYFPGAEKAYSQVIMEKKKAETGKEKNKPSITDWEFSSQSLPKGKKQKTGMQHCSSCHDYFNDTGYVSKKSEKLLQEFLKTGKKEDQPAKNQDKTQR